MYTITEFVPEHYYVHNLSLIVISGGLHEPDCVTGDRNSTGFVDSIDEAQQIVNIMEKGTEVPLSLRHVVRPKYWNIPSKFDRRKD